MRKPSGKVNPIAVLLVLAFAGGVYWAVMFGPLYLDNLDVREAVDSAFSRYPVEGEDRARQYLLNRLNVRTQEGIIGHHFEVDEDGVEKELPGLNVAEDNVSFDFEERKSELTVRVEYDRVVVLKPTQKRRTIHFVVQKTGAIQ